MSNLKDFLRKNLPSVIVLVALILIAGIALATKFSVSADTAVVSVGSEVNYDDEDESVIDAGEPAAEILDADETPTTEDLATEVTTEESEQATTTSGVLGVSDERTPEEIAVASTSASVTPSVTSTTACLQTVTVAATVTAGSTRTATTTTIPCSTATPVAYRQGLKGTYFKKIDLKSPVLARLDSNINFDWKNDSPQSGLVPVNSFSARWNGFVTPAYSEEYTFTLKHNDGVRLWIDKKLIIDKWVDSPTTAITTSTGTATLVANKKYPITVEYYDKTTKATVTLGWKSKSQVAQIIPKAKFSTQYDPNPPVGKGIGLIGTYYSGISFAKKIVARRDTTVNFNWAANIPANKVPADNFSVKWNGQIQPRFTEAYTFYVKSSEGVRLYVNGKKVIDKWVAQPTAKENNGAIRLVAGKKYNIRLEYYEKTGNASASLMWSSPSQRKQVVPKSQLFSGTIINPTATPTQTSTCLIPEGCTATPTKTATKTATKTPYIDPSKTPSPVGDKVTIKKGFNTVVVGVGKGLISTSSFTSKGMKVFAFNRDGKYTTHPTSAVNWETSLQYMNHGVGYYVYNPGAQVDVTVSYSKAIEAPTDVYMTTGWNLLGISGATDQKLADINRYLSSGCSISSTGIASCTTKGTNQSIKTLINSKKGYAYIPVIVNGNTSDPAQAFNYITVTSDNIDTVTIPAGKAFWFYIFP